MLCEYRQFGLILFLILCRNITILLDWTSRNKQVLLGIRIQGELVLMRNIHKHPEAPGLSGRSRTIRRIGRCLSLCVGVVQHGSWNVAIDSLVNRQIVPYG